MKAYTIMRSPFSSKARHVGDPKARHVGGP